MAELRSEEHGTLLDPVGALIYYLSVSHAIESGINLVPSSHEISRLLELRSEKRRRMAVNADVQWLWEDLWWMKCEGLLFDERAAKPTDYWRSLSQHNVNARMRSFQPGFDQQHPRGRHIVSQDFVERAKTAARLIALKDLYRFNERELPHPLLFEFLQRELIPNQDECFTFLHSMHTVRYIQILPTPDWLPKTPTDKTALLEPSQTFRNQDMYLELRALDHFATHRGDPSRRAKRLELHHATKQFVASHATRAKRVI